MCSLGKSARDWLGPSFWWGATPRREEDQAKQDIALCVGQMAIWRPLKGSDSPKRRAVEC